MLRFTPSLPASSRLPDLLLPVPLLLLAAAARVSVGITPSSGTRPTSVRFRVPGILRETPAPAGRREPRLCFPTSQNPYTRFSTLSSRPPFFPPFFGGYWCRPFGISSQEFISYWTCFVCGGRELHQELGSAYTPSTVCGPLFCMGFYFGGHRPTNLGFRLSGASQAYCGHGRSTTTGLCGSLSVSFGFCGLQHFITIHSSFGCASSLPFSSC